MGPLRDIPPDKLLTMGSSDLRPVNEKDFARTLKEFKPSVSKKSIQEYDQWNKDNSNV